MKTELRTKMVGKRRVLFTITNGEANRNLAGVSGPGTFDMSTISSKLRAHTSQSFIQRPLTGFHVEVSPQNPRSVAKVLDGLKDLRDNLKSRSRPAGGRENGQRHRRTVNCSSQELALVFTVFHVLSKGQGFTGKDCYSSLPSLLGGTCRQPYKLPALSRKPVSHSRKLVPRNTAR